jgi:hypothetical protein
MRLFSEYGGPDLPFWKSDPYKPPEHETDVVFKEHDEAYGEYSRLGFIPWIWYNKADNILLEKLSKIKPKSERERYIHNLAQDYFKTKKNTVGHLGWIHKHDQYDSHTSPLYSKFIIKYASYKKEFIRKCYYR